MKICLFASKLLCYLALIDRVGDAYISSSLVYGDRHLLDPTFAYGQLSNVLGFELTMAHQEDVALVTQL